MSASIDLSTSVVKIIIKYDEIDGGKSGTVNILSKS